jgi:pimeloyl-ACP methyl ester carboxylesterase
MSRNTQHLSLAQELDPTTGWDLSEHGQPAGRATSTVLLLPGMMCTSAFYDDVLMDTKVGASDLRWVAATPPGFGGQPVPKGFDPTIEGYAELTAQLAAHLGSDILVGHSYFANVVLELVATGRFTGRAILLSPCFHAEDEEGDTKTLNKLARIPGLGRIVWGMLPKMMKTGMKGKFPESRQDALVREMQRFNGQFTRKLMRNYFDYFTTHGSLVADLCDARVPTWVIRGDEDEIALSDQDRAQLELGPTVDMVTIPDAHHFSLVDQPGDVVDVVLRAALVEPFRRGARA